MTLEEKFRRGLARGYCHPDNSSKELDCNLIEAMVTEALSICQQAIDEAKEEGFNAGCDYTCKQYGDGKTEAQIIDDACKKQREICADAFMTKEDYLYIKLNTPDTISTLKRDEILNAPSPKESE